MQCPKVHQVHKIPDNHNVGNVLHICNFHKINHVHLSYISPMATEIYINTRVLPLCISFFCVIEPFFISLRFEYRDDNVGLIKRWSKPKTLFFSLVNFVLLADSIQWISKNVLKRFPFSHLSWLLWAKSNCGQNCQKHFQFQLFLTFSPAHLYLLKPYIVTRKATHKERKKVLINLFCHISCVAT